MRKPQFGDLVQSARRRKGYSLRDLAERTGMNYSRLSRIEHGTRPAPGLAEIRSLAESLDVDMSDLLVSSGTPREVMEHLLWSERLQGGGSVRQRTVGPPDWSDLLAKNTFRVPVAGRDGALCRVLLGREALDVFHFGRGRELVLSVPPEAVGVFRDRPDPASSTVENVLPVRVKKVRRLGQVTNLVLAGDGFELNAVHAARVPALRGFAEGDSGFATVPVAAVRTGSYPQEGR